MQNPSMQDLRSEIAASAARLVVEDGLDYGAAKRRAARDSGAASRVMLPDNQQIEEAVREHLSLFHGQTQPRELLVLRRLALVWMDRLLQFRPHLTGAAWNGTATRHSGIQLDLFCDDPKLAEITVVNMGLRLEPHRDRSSSDEGATRVRFLHECEDLQTAINIFLCIKDYDMIRGGLRADRLGRSPRGDITQVRRLVEETRLV
jgi:hypothetical protein